MVEPRPIADRIAISVGGAEDKVLGVWRSRARCWGRKFWQVPTIIRSAIGPDLIGCGVRLDRDRLPVEL